VTDAPRSEPPVAATDTPAGVAPVHRCAEPGEAFPDWKDVFGSEMPLHVECGAGKGLFAREFAARHPDLAFVAIETRRIFVEGLRAKAARLGLGNLHVLQGDARQLIERAFPPESVAAFHVHFPDPWWKRKHWKRRLVDADLAALLHRLLVPGGVVDFRTDILAYAEEAARSFAEAGFRAEPPPERAEPEVLSNRERGYAAKGREVFRFTLRKAGAARDNGRAAQPSRTGRDWTDVRRR
jgi:tRNA (guanine-N7-)-methyltransferase